MKRSDKREEFLTCVLVTAVESNPYTPWFAFEDYNPDEGTVTVWHDKDGDGNYSDGPYHITLDDIARGLKLFTKNWEEPQGWRKKYPNDYKPKNKNSYAYQLILQDRTNGDEGDSDVTTCDSVMQWAVLGEEIYG